MAGLKIEVISLFELSAFFNAIIWYLFQLFALYWFSVF